MAVDEHRMILAVFSAICGCIVLALAVWHAINSRRLHGKWHRGWALWAYGGLFCLASFILWERDHSVQIAPSVPQPKAISVLPNTPSETAGKSDSAIKRTAPNAPKTEATPDVFQESPLTGDSSFFIDEKIVLRQRDLRPPTNRRSLSPYSPLPTTGFQNRPIEEVVYVAVSHTFDAIENWFFRYGAANTASYDVDRRRMANDWDSGIAHLPPVFFTPNTAELTAESASALRHIAGLFRSHAEASVIEIQARTESKGPEPYNYILTQARAEVVRDFLLKEGINTDRLVARAMGSGGADSTAQRSHIRFVVQP